MLNSIKELQEDIIKNKTDIISILRKAHIIAIKTNQKEFDKWIQQEQNGYENYKEIPDYRAVIGDIKARNPYHGLIPVMLSEDFAAEFKSRKLFEPISTILDFYNKNQNCSFELPSEISKILCAGTGVTLPCYFVFGSHQLIAIINSVKNKILDWCISLEQNENMENRNDKKQTTNKRDSTLTCDVFISHANRDKIDYVDELKESLDKLKIKIFYDKDSLEWGDNWKQRILDGVKESEFAIIVISENFFDREWTEKELNEFLNRQNRNGQKIILPILHNITIEQLKAKYPAIADIQALNSKDYSCDEIALQFAGQLIKRLKA